MSRPIQIQRPARRFACLAHDGSGASSHSRILPEETAIALVYGGSTEAVMMATPADLEDFAIGFSVTEGLIEHPAQIADLAVIHGTDGIELRMWLAGGRENVYRLRRRTLAGPTGCGLCGIESLAQAVRPAAPVRCKSLFDAREIPGAMAALASAQMLHRETRATHAAGLYRPGDGLIAAREDVGRHNALDKLAGALSRCGAEISGGAVVITSRVSVEMVQKAAVIGAPLLVAVSAPTALAVRVAESANITLIAVAREQSFQVFSHPWRLEKTD
jgi:FdhD protein